MCQDDHHKQRIQKIQAEDHRCGVEERSRTDEKVDLGFHKWLAHDGQGLAGRSWTPRLGSSAGLYFVPTHRGRTHKPVDKVKTDNFRNQLLSALLDDRPFATQPTATRESIAQTTR